MPGRNETPPEDNDLTTQAQEQRRAAEVRTAALLAEEIAQRLQQLREQVAVRDEIVRQVTSFLRRAQAELDKIDGLAGKPK